MIDDIQFPKQEQKGKLDILVNNAYAGVSLIDRSSGKKFYETDPVEQWDVINGVGLRLVILFSKALYNTLQKAELRT